MLTPTLSPKLEAYVQVLSKIRDLKLKRGLYPVEYTRQVNREIEAIRARMMASAHRAKTAEGLKEMFRDKPDLAARWKILKLQRGYLNAARRQDKIYREIEAMKGAQS